MTSYFVSDLHIGDGSKKDNFAVNADKFRLFLEMIGNDTLYCIGDSYELWQCEYDDCVRKYSDIYKRLTFATQIEGNHDSSLSFSKWHVLDNALLIHGHQFDKYNKDGAKWGKWITKAFGWIEPIFPNLQIVDRLWRDNDKYFQPLYDMAVKYNCDTIIFGHTHIPANEFRNGIHFLNAGSWVDGICHYIKYENSRYILCQLQ